MAQTLWYKRPFVSELFPVECGLVQTQKYLRKAASSGTLMEVVPRAARQLGLSWAPLTFHSEGLIIWCFPACEMLNGHS